MINIRIFFRGTVDHSCTLERNIYRTIYYLLLLERSLKSKYALKLVRLYVQWLDGKIIILFWINLIEIIIWFRNRRSIFVLVICSNGRLIVTLGFYLSMIVKPIRTKYCIRVYIINLLLWNAMAHYCIEYVWALDASDQSSGKIWIIWKYRSIFQ